MAQSNDISININADDLQAIKDAINVLKIKLAPLLTSLTSDEKKELPKMGDKTVAFVEKAYNYSKENRDLIPPFLDVGEFKIDVDAITTLRELYIPLAAIVENLDDSILLSGSEAYQAALIFYNSAKYAAKSGIPNAESVYKDLAARFPGGRPKKSS